MKALGIVNGGAVALHDPLVPTRPPGDSSNAIATTRFVTRAVAEGGGGGGAVASVFGRIGVVTAQAGDYSFSQISGTVAPAQMTLFTATANGAVPASGGSNVLFLRADGNWAPVPGGLVSSVFGRAGAVVAQTGDYSFLQISGTAAPAQLPLFTATTAGIVPASGGGGVTFLRADGTWAPVGSVTTPPFVYQSASFNAASLISYIVDATAAPLTVTLPAAPGVGAFTWLMDANSTWGINNVTVAGNGSNIASSSSSLILNISGSLVLLVYVNATIGWQVNTS